MCSRLEAYLYASGQNHFVTQTKTLSSFHRFNKHVLFIIKINMTQVRLVNWCSSGEMLKKQSVYFLAILSPKVWFNDDESKSSWANMNRQVYPPSLVTVHLRLGMGRLWNRFVDTSWYTVWLGFKRFRCFLPHSFSELSQSIAANVQGNWKPEGLSIVHTVKGERWWQLLCLNESSAPAEVFKSENIHIMLYAWLARAFKSVSWRTSAHQGQCDRPVNVVKTNLYYIQTHHNCLFIFH